MQTKRPRPYLSWSQYNLFKNSVSNYVDYYVYENKRASSRAMLLGKLLHEKLEKGETLDKELENVKMFLPDFKEKEFEINTEVAGVPLYGKLDGFNPKTLVIDDIKTGKTNWTQRKVDTDKQMTFYALMVYQKFGKLPENIRIHHIPTEEAMGVIVFTGELFSFSTKRTLSQVIDMAVEVKKTWDKIGEVCTEEYKSIGK